jgi:ATP-dependent Clp protease ATP-binding subunit ClpC
MGNDLTEYEEENTENGDNENTEEVHDLSNVNSFGNHEIDPDAGAPASTTPFLDNLGRDITQEANDGEIQPVIGREKEIQQIILILARKNKNNPIIIGEAGVGKTAIVEGIALKMVGEDCPESLEDKRIMYIDMGTIMAGASKQGDLEKRIQQLIREVSTNPDVILFIDEIHMIVNENIPVDVSNMLKPALGRGKMRLIGATTLDEYQKTIEKDDALNRRFQKVKVDPTSVKDTLEILSAIKDRYEEFHNVRYTEEALISCIRLSDRYITDRHLPDKAIDLLDESGAKARLSRTTNIPPEILELELELLRVKDDKNEATKIDAYEEAAKARERELEIQDELIVLGKKYTDEQTTEIYRPDIEQIVSNKTGIDVSRMTPDQGKRLLRLEADLNIDIIGQGEATNKVAKCVRRSASGLNDPNRPNGVFLFLGSTGVGKTHTVKMLAKNIFNSTKDVIRIDMSEYQDAHTSSRMIGSPPGYVGYDEGGQLTEKVRRNPNSIILLDEIEKAHPRVLDVLLQVFDDGHLTDGQGKEVDFKNTIIVMTSNIGTYALENQIDKVGFGASTPISVTAQEEKNKTIILKELKKSLRPEFINRIDDVVIFKALSEEAIYKIIDNEVGNLAKRLGEMEYDLTITDNVKTLLLEQGYDVKMGARPLKRAIRKYIEDPISDAIVGQTIQAGDKIEMDYDTSANRISINGELIAEEIATTIKDPKKV